MHAETFKAATSLTASTLACTLFRVQGYFKGTADAWLQIHDTNEKPATGAVPVKVYALPYNAPFEWLFDPASLNLTVGCFVGVSSTEGTYTELEYSANTVYCDIEVDFGPVNSRPVGFSVAGDGTAIREDLTVWTDAVANALKRLYAVSYTNKSGADAYLLFFAKAPNEGDTPLLSVFVEKDGVYNYAFGDDGMGMASVEGLDGTNGTRHYGCFLAESSTAMRYTPTLANASFIRAEYK